MEDNVTASETNGIASDSTLVDKLQDGNAVQIMRECADKEHGMGWLRDKLGVECATGWQMRCLGKLADMVERDYVRRDEINDGLTVLNAIDRLRRDLSGYHGQLKAHNDMQRHCDNQRKRIVELEKLYADVKAERNEWQAKAEKYAEALEKLGCSVLANGTVFEPPEGSSKVRAGSSKRAAAVERLRKLPPMDTTGLQFVNAMVGPIAFMKAQDIHAALIDLLTDDDGVEHSTTNLEWYYLHDSDFAWKVDNWAWEAGGFSTSQPLDELPWTHPKMREWLMSEHVDSQDFPKELVIPVDDFEWLKSYLDDEGQVSE